MDLPHANVEDHACTTCGQLRTAHPFQHTMPMGRCFEWRNAPEDTVLACVLRLMRLYRPHAVHEEKDWRARLQALNIPTEVPAARWGESIARALACAGVMSDMPATVALPTAQAIGHNGMRPTI